MLRNEIKNILKKVTGIEAKIEYPATPEHGDYATNVAMEAGLKPEAIITKINNVLASDIKTLEKVEAKNGFINFFIAKEYLQEQIGEILKQKNNYGNLKIGNKQKVQVEFISANPTGPLTLGNGRGGFCGDVLANVLAKADYDVEREYYVNDRGEQIKQLGHSVMGDKEAVYKGRYITSLRKKIKGKNAEAVGEAAAREVLETMIKPTVKKMGIKFDSWFSENSLYQNKKVDEMLDWLKEHGLTDEKEEALWFRSTKFEDDKDRVLIKADGEKTYLASDIAYLKDKKDRGFKRLVYFWGADHHGYVARMRAAAQALGFNHDNVRFVLMQLVRLFQEGKEVRMSKREGVYVTLDKLMKEIGVDAARFFFLMRAANTHLNFDMDLAKEQSDKNPVYYVQYAHARISSILRKATIKPDIKHLNMLDKPAALKLIKQLIKLPEVIEDTASDYQVQRLPKYATDLATAFHKFYTDCRVIDEKKPDLTEARLALTEAAKLVLNNILSIMGISAPEKM